MNSPPGPDARDDHDEAQMKLPWYATGRLQPDERARVELHINGCAACRADLMFEAWLERELRELPLEADAAWQGVAHRLADRRGRQGEQAPSAGVRWALAAQFAAVVVLLGLAGVQVVQGPAYRTLSADPSPQGDVLVMLQPGTTEVQMRRLLRDADARFADGPTSAGAYVLRARDADRTAARLRRSPAVVMAEPLAPGAGP